MEEVTDMDNLLDEMESDLMRKSHISQPLPVLPPTSIAMQPRGFKQKSQAKHVVAVSKFVIDEDMNRHMEGHINIDSSALPNTFHPKQICRSSSDEKQTTKENILPTSQNEGTEEEVVHIVKEEKLTEDPQVISEKVIPQKTVEDEPLQKIHSEPEPEEISETEEETLIPETQVISNLNCTTRDADKPIQEQMPEKEILELDTEMESMLDYLNGVDGESVPFETIETTPKSSLEEPVRTIRKEGGRDLMDDMADDSIVSQFADKLSEEVMAAALTNRKMHYDPAVQEFYRANDSIPDVFSMSLDSTHSSLNQDSSSDNSNYLSEPEHVIKQRLPSVIEQSEEVEESSEVFDEKEMVSEIENASIDVEDNDAFADTESNSHEARKQESEVEIHKESESSEEAIEIMQNALKTDKESLSDDLKVDCVIAEQNGEVVSNENVESEDDVTSDDRLADRVEHQSDKFQETTIEEPKDLVAENSELPGEDETFEPPALSQLALLETVQRVDDVVETASDESQESPLEEGNDNEEGRSRFDSSIATVHVLHESDSDESVAPRRERRLTESELQLGKTSPYWIPDSECPLCMLCNTKFTILTRRHHCRACGRVLCGSCCNEKAVLEYLQEEGKKPQAVRVCKPCSSMLARIESHEQEEQRRRESVVSDGPSNEDEASSSAAPVSAVVPRGVLKTRSMTQGNEDEGASTSSHFAPTSSNRSVMFRDGVRPGAPVDEEFSGEERSTALKPKKKSRKRTAVVRRIAELRMEDELQCALPKGDATKLLVLKPDYDQPKFENASNILESLCNFSIITVVLKKNLNCTVQIFNNPNFGLVWAVSTQGFAQIGLDELFFSWTLNDKEKQKVDAEEPELHEQTALSLLPLSVLHRISTIYTHSTEHEYAGVRRVDNRLMRVHTVPEPKYPVSKHIMFFRPTIQAGLGNMRIPTNPFLIACFLHDDELNWAIALPNRLLYKLGEKYNVFPTPFVNNVGRPALYSTDVSGTVLKVFTDFRSWSYRMKHIPGCTVSLSNDKTVIRIPKSCIKELKDILNLNRSMVAWSCDFSQEDDSVLVCEETDPGLYSTQVFAKYIGQRESTSASFVILDGGSKVNSLQVNVVEDGVAIRLQSDRLETILNAINEGHDVVESSKDMEFRVEFVEDGDWISPDTDYYPKSQIDGLSLINKFQYGLSLERALTQVLQVQGVTDYGVRMSHVYNLGDGRLQPEEEPKIYGMVEIAARECVAMLEPHIQYLIHAGINSVSIRLFVSPYEFEYDVSRWLGLEAENDKYKQSLDQLIPMLCNMVEYVPNGFEVEFVLSIVSTRALPIQCVK
ncbi:unnamed protein product [Caenorhabditis brenneri]